MSEIEIVHALADGELKGEELTQATEALSSSSALKAEYESVVAMKSALNKRRGALASDEAWRLCVKRLDDIDRSKKATSFVSRYQWAMAGALFLVIAIGGMINRANGAGTLHASDIPAMVSGMSPLAPPSSVQRSGGLQNWVAGHVGAAPIQRCEKELAVVGLAEGTVEGRPAARITLQDGSGNVDLFVIAGINDIRGVQDGDGSPFSEGNINGISCVGWSQEGFGFVLIGDRSSSELERVAKMVSGLE